MILLLSSSTNSCSTSARLKQPHPHRHTQASAPPSSLAVRHHRCQHQQQALSPPLSPPSNGSHRPSQRFLIDTLETKLGLRNMALLGTRLLLINYIGSVAVAIYLPQKKSVGSSLMLGVESQWAPIALRCMNGHVGFMLSCYDAQLSYGSTSDNFVAKYKNLLYKNLLSTLAVHGSIEWC
ncbi:uncharacterized protein LOC130988163 isoform X2 [Salvia miltiorrhiza]|uniref:uncharacterized protein LOC130988163 isoform X2 n=1 Tax=Salvia miltiorrhiza TaxID=226208 RepID=UPI0025AD65B8|nr:uncharacterized protein LOC130988163 isoform X2 [Salvia miltiorrhiza]